MTICMMLLFVCGIMGAQTNNSQAGRYSQEELTERQRVEEEKYKMACKTGSIILLKEYLELYPNGKHREDVKNRIADYDLWAKAKAENTVAAYENYIQNSKTNNYLSQANSAIAAIKEEEVKAEARAKAEASAKAAAFEISSTSAHFSADGGTKTFTVSSGSPWRIGASPASWGTLTKNGNTLTLKVIANHQSSSREDWFSVVTASKTIRVNITQAAAASVSTSSSATTSTRSSSVSSLLVNGTSAVHNISFGQYGGCEEIRVTTNASGYELSSTPSWCSVYNKTSEGFTLGCRENKSSYSRRDDMEVIAGDKSVRINVYQDANSIKERRRRSGGWLNMPIGFEGGISLYKDYSWNVNGVLGLRIGNYADIFQLELGVLPGLMSVNQHYTEDSGYGDNYYGDYGYDYDYSSPTEESVRVNSFYLPLYASLKISSRSGDVYFKITGIYNQIIETPYMGSHSARVGFGTAAKTFEWDWAYVQYNSQDSYSSSPLMPELMFGMRMAWFITR